MRPLPLMYHLRWLSADLLTLLCGVFSCVFAISHMVWYLIVSIPELCLPLYFLQDSTNHDAIGRLADCPGRNSGHTRKPDLQDIPKIGRGIATQLTCRSAYNGYASDLINKKYMKQKRELQ